MAARTLTVDRFFAPFPASRVLFDALMTRLSARDVKTRVTKSEIALLVEDKVIARVWIPDRYLHGQHAPLVLTLSFGARDASPRWKEITEVRKGRFTHHLEIASPQEIDDEVLAWIDRAIVTASEQKKR